MCWEKNSAIVGETAAEAKAFLISRYEIGPRSAPCIKSKEEGIGGLNADFAVRVARMIQDMEKQLGGRNIVRSAFRPGACGGGVGHSHGCAVDIEWAHSGGWRPASDNPNVLETQWVKTNGGNSQYRIHHPFPYPPEWHHIEPMDRASCLAGRAIDPNVGGTQASPPSAGLSNGLRQALGMNMQPSAQPPLPPQPVSPQQPLGGTQPSQFFPSSASGGTPSTGVSGTSNTSGGTAVTSGVNSTSNMQNPLPNLEKPKPSVAQQLFDIAYGTQTATTSSTATTVPITFDTSDIGGIAGNTQATNDTRSIGQAPNVAATPPQTFVSSDLNFSSSQAAPSQGTLSQVLADLRTALMRILAVLRPFGIRSAIESSIHGGDDFAE